MDWNDPNVQFLDLNGDGFADILRTEGERLVWYPSKGKDGFDAAIVIPIGRDERKGPAVVFANPEQSIHVADMSGDGLSDIVRSIRTPIGSSQPRASPMSSASKGRSARREGV